MSHFQRRDRLRGRLEQDSDGLLVTNPVNVSYLTGFTGDSSYLLLGRKRDVLVSDARFTAQLADECPDLECSIRPPTQLLGAAAAEVVDKFGVHRLEFESQHLTVSDFEGLRNGASTVNWLSASGKVESLRAIKDADEIAQIREAIDIAERAFTAVRSLLGPSDSEKGLSDAIEGAIRKAGGKSSSFPSIVAVGDRAALPHAPPTGRRIDEADFVLIDWGASGRFYKSDLTRVLATRKISPKLQEVHAVVMQAREQALAVLRPGVRSQEVDAAARNAIAAAGYGEFFGHGLGHGIGMQVHEAPSLRPNSETVLQAGMVVTIEPGVYLPGWGGVRIEDDVLLTPDGYEVLTRLTRDLEPVLS